MSGVGAWYPAERAIPRIAGKGGVVALAIMIAFTASGCSAGPPGLASGAPVDRMAKLRSLPTYQESAKSYLAMLHQMRAALAGLAPALEWSGDPIQQVGDSFCGEPYARLKEAAAGTFDGGHADGDIPAAAWPQVRAAVVAIAARHGFTDVLPGKGAPDDRMLVIGNRQEGSVELISQLETTLVVYGSCFLRELPRTPSAATPPAATSSAATSGPASHDGPA